MENSGLMFQKSIKIFVEEVYSKPPKRNYITNKTDVYSIDYIWSSDNLDSKDFGPENNRGHRCVLVIIDNFSKFGWTVPLKKNGITIKDTFEKFLLISKENQIYLKVTDERNFILVLFKIPK